VQRCLLVEDFFVERFVVSDFNVEKLSTTKTNATEMAAGLRYATHTRAWHVCAVPPLENFEANVPCRAGGMQISLRQNSSHKKLMLCDTFVGRCVPQSGNCVLPRQFSP